MSELIRGAPSMQARDVSVRIARLAGQQFGVVTRTQLLACGLPASAISRWVAAGRLHRLYPSVYAVGHLALTEESHLVAALFYAGPGSALSHRIGCWWWGFTSNRGATIDISAMTRRSSVEGIRIHRPRRLERVFHRQLPVTPVARTLVDFASIAHFRELRKALAEADFQRLLDPDAIRAVMGRGVPGSAALRAALECHLPELARTLSPNEDVFLFFCEQHDLPLPLVNHRVAGKKVDAFWPDHRVIVELDSVIAHSSPARRLVDRERDLHLRRLGFTVLRYTWHQLHATPELVAAELRTTLAAAAAKAN
jgi:predicted transcriptional regulator of viral defense system